MMSETRKTVLRKIALAAMSSPDEPEFRAEWDWLMERLGFTARVMIAETVEGAKSKGGQRGTLRSSRIQCEIEWCCYPAIRNCLDRDSCPWYGAEHPIGFLRAAAQREAVRLELWTPFDRENSRFAREDWDRRAGESAQSEWSDRHNRLKFDGSGIQISQLALEDDDGGHLGYSETLDLLNLKASATAAVKISGRWKAGAAGRSDENILDTVAIDWTRVCREVHASPQLTAHVVGRATENTIAADATTRKQFERARKDIADAILRQIEEQRLSFKKAA